MRWFTLKELCIQKTAELLKSTYWNPRIPSSENPFRFFISDTIENLIEKVVDMSDRSRPLLSSDLQLLIRSGKVRHFELQCALLSNIYVDEINLAVILMELSSSCHLLQSVNLSFSFRDENLRSPHVIRGVNCLLKEARNLTCFESSIYFDINALGNCDRLEKLSLEFSVAPNSVLDLLQVNGQLRPRNSLKYLRIVTTDGKVDYLDIAVILKYCPELQSINCDISRSLEHLHAYELYNGTLTHTYKLIQFELGENMGRDSVCASRDAVLIAAITCPFLKELFLYVNDQEAICALHHCCKLDSLDIHWHRVEETDEYGDFNVGVKCLLGDEEFGANLKCLELEWFTDIDYDWIGQCCSELLTLRIANNLPGNMCSEFSPTSYENLENFTLINSVSEGFENDVPVGLLSSAWYLEEVMLCNAKISDDMLLEILKRNSLSKVKNFHAELCYFSPDSWGLLAENLRSLRTLIAMCFCTPHEEVRAIFHEQQPYVSVYFLASD